MTDCNEYEILISCLIDGEITPEEHARLEAHLAVCPECRALYEYMRPMCASLAVLEKEPPAELLTGVMAAVAQAKAKKPVLRLRYYIAAAAMLAVVIFAVAAFPQLTKNKSSEVLGFASSDATSESSNNAPSAAAPNGGLGDQYFVASDETETTESFDCATPSDELTASGALSIPESSLEKGDSDDMPLAGIIGIGGQSNDMRNDTPEELPEFEGYSFSMYVFAHGEVELPEGALLLSESAEELDYVISIENAEELAFRGYEYCYTDSNALDALLVVYPD